MKGADSAAQRARALLDTGPLVALLNRDDRDHARCRKWFEGYRGILVSTEAVLTEATHLLGRSRLAQRAAITFFERRAAVLVPMTLPGLQACRTVMEKYDDVPMDFADASLVVLGDELAIRDIATLDRRGFGAYRSSRGRAFRLLPG